jgi:hypothetical protein
LTQAFTDSGYGSRGTKTITAHDRLDAIEESQGQHDPLTESVGISGSDDSQGHQETRTVYSDTFSLQNPNIREYISAFADELCGSLPPEFDANDLERISSALPSLFKSFAVRLGHESSAVMQRQLMYLVYRYRL